jgi:hypothetical protein
MVDYRLHQFPQFVEFLGEHLFELVSVEGVVGGDGFEQLPDFGVIRVQR